MVQNDPKGDQHEFLLKKGKTDISRNGEAVRLSDWEKVTFKSDAQKMDRLKEIGPPTPISPANMMPIFVSGSTHTKDVEFSWTPMANAVSYRLRLSKNPYFSSLVVDRRIEVADVTVTSLGEGAYYWSVQSYDANGKGSVESEKNRFTVNSQGKRHSGDQSGSDPFVQHGHVIEVTGKTEVGARVMVNGREVPMVATDGSFPLFHAASAERREHDHDHGTECARWGEHAAEEDRDSVRPERGETRPGKNFRLQQETGTSHRIKVRPRP